MGRAVISDLLIRRKGTLHAIRPVPAEFASLDQRGVIRHSTRIGVAEDRVGHRAAHVAHASNGG